VAITRAQIPEQIDAFQEGGGAETNTTDPTTETNITDPTADLITSLRDALVTDYGSSYNKYLDRLSQFAPEKPKMNIFQVASELGRGLLSTPNTGVGSAFRGLSVGFDNVSQRLKADREAFEKQRQEVAMLASQMAMQDEQRAKDFLDEIALKMIGDTNSEVKTQFISYIDPESGDRVDRLFDKSSPDFKEIISNPEKYKAQKINEPLIGSNKYEALDKNTADAITDQETSWQEESNAQYGVLDKLEAAKYFANGLREQDFGNFQVTFGVPIKNIMTSIGFGDLIDQDRLGRQIAVNSVGTGLAMGLISQTKGAISDREMGMFLAASATLGNNKNGFLKILDLTEKIARKAVGYNDAWLKERARLQSEGVNLAEIRAAQANFQRKYHAENPLFSGSKDADGNDIYNPDLSIKENLANLTPGTEAYDIVAAMTDEGIAEYERLAALHSEISTNNLIEKQNLAEKQIATGIEGVPDGSKLLGKNQDGNDVYLTPNGDVIVVE
tara:strand:- start:2471 stop:3970 length:1500 start_codon:yes stop_codon:yes gene_type:complete